MNALVIAPHMDDEVLGCGGTIARHVDQGDLVTVCVIANGAYGHHYDPEAIAEEKRAAQNARKTLGYQRLVFLDLSDERLDLCLQDIIIPLELVYDDVSPDVVYLNHIGDLNQDHRAVAQAAMVVVRPHSGKRPRTVVAYEVPSSTDQVFPMWQNVYQPNFYVDVTDYLEKKLAALRCYERESRIFPHPRSPEGIELNARKRGTEIGLEAAEAFVMLRDEWRKSERWRHSRELS